MTRLVAMMFVFAALISALLSSCAASGYRKAESAASEMNSLRDNVQFISEDLAAVQGSLQRVLAPAGDGTVQAFQDFERQLDDVQSRISSADRNLTAVKSRGQSYFESWQKQIATIQDDEIRADATKRREDLLRAQAELDEAMEAVRPQREALLVSLKDLRVYFSNDLSAPGIELARNPVGRIDSDIAALRNRFDEIARLIDRTSPGFTPAVLEAPPAP